MNNINDFLAEGILFVEIPGRGMRIDTSIQEITNADGTISKIKKTERVEPKPAIYKANIYRQLLYSFATTPTSKEYVTDKNGKKILKKSSYENPPYQDRINAGLEEHARALVESHGIHFTQCKWRFNNAL